MNKYKLVEKNKHQFRMMIDHDDDIIQKYGLHQNDVIYYNIYIDKNFNKHIIISKEEVKNKQIIYFVKGKIYKNSQRSLKLTFYFNYFLIKFFNLKNFNYVSLKDLSINNGLLFELLLI